MHGYSGFGGVNLTAATGNDACACFPKPHG